MTEQPSPPVRGRIDLHCHLIPGVDDGCQFTDESLECVRLWSESGFTGSVCTPHMASSYFPENTPQRVERQTAQLRRELERAGIDYTLWSGGEVRLSRRVIDWFELHGTPVLGEGRCVLIDWWSHHWPSYCTDACDWLLERNYQPVLAHPERMGLDEREFSQVIDRLLDRGVWLQGNVNSLGGGEGPQAEERAWRLLESDRYYALATDTHAPDSVFPRRRGVEATLQRCGAERTRQLLEDRPREILRWGAATD